jgi:hypothetical protein
VKHRIGIDSVDPTDCTVRNGDGQTTAARQTGIDVGTDRELAPENAALRSIVGRDTGESYQRLTCCRSRPLLIAAKPHHC